MSAIFFKKIK